MSRSIHISSLIVWGLFRGWHGCAAEDGFRGGETNELLEIRSVAVNGEPISLRAGKRLHLSPQPEKVSFGFGPATNSERAPLRIRYKLDGYDDGWREVAGEMRLSVRFFDGSGDHVSERVFRAIGQTEGWTGTPETSVFSHHQETIAVPPRAKGFWVVMSSAGPPATVGIYLITNLTVTALSSSNHPPDVLLRWAFDRPGESGASEEIPAGWMRDGLRPKAAKTVEFGTNRKVKAFAIIDDDANGHAEWHTLKESAPAVSPGDRLVVAWDEAYSLGLAGFAEVLYPELPTGYFRFRINELTILGTPGQAEASLALEVPAAFWKTPWFWISALTVVMATSTGGWRYLAWRRMQRQLQRLEQQHAVERERLRIAQDIHDDWGARVTQISLLSAVAQRKPSLPDEARADFGTISQMTRDLVSALYETVWAVDPENDNLEALANYLCQVGNQLCSQAQLRCRLEVPSSSPNIPLTSQVRHNLIMAVKEAIHNIIKHARASEVHLRIAFEAPVLSVSIHDDGCGFNPATPLPGNGLGNLKRRLDDIGGSFRIESQPGLGTTVRLRLLVRPIS